MDAIDGIKQTFKLKNDKAKTSAMYLEYSTRKVTSVDVANYWGISADAYIKQTIITIEYKLHNKMTYCQVDMQLNIKVIIILLVI